MSARTHLAEVVRPLPSTHRSDRAVANRQRRGLRPWRLMPLDRKPAPRRWTAGTRGAGLCPHQADRPQAGSASRCRCSEEAMFRHSAAHLRHASAHTRQCVIWPWRSHSSAHISHTSAHETHSEAAAAPPRATPADAVRQISAQSRSSRMQSRSFFTSLSFKHALAQSSQACAQTSQASMHL